jgi:N-methylhydantoinase B/oxoprolinase/acetone carboxylase alpha subunit
VARSQSTNTKNTPTEALERAYPMRVRRYRLRRGSGGEGVASGGDGIERDLEVVGAAGVSRRLLAALAGDPRR